MKVVNMLPEELWTDAEIYMQMNRYVNVFVHEWFNKWKINLNLRPWGFQYNEIWTASLRVIGGNKAKLVHRKWYGESYNFIW